MIDSELKRGRRLHLLARATAALFIAVTALIFASAANAATDHYCDGCFLAINQAVIDTWPHNPMTLSYIHYVGTGYRVVAAGAENSNGVIAGGYTYGAGTATHSYSYPYWLWAIGANADCCHGLTANLHADY